MKTIPLHTNAKQLQLISQLKRKESLAQKEIYDLQSPKMLSVCRMYVKDVHHAEDCMIKGFVKVFKNIAQFSEKGSFEGWMRRIMVNECLNFLKAQKKMLFVDDEVINEEVNTQDFGFDAQDLLDQLPEGYKVVFNLFVMEEMSHKEISGLLQISESTSKSQLFKAKKKLREFFNIQKTVQK